MNKILEKPFLAVSVLLILCAYLFFFKLGGMALTDPDETFYAQTAKEMLNRGDWSTPYLFGKPQFEKPIMIYWLVGASYKMFGVHETAARLPSAIFALLGVIAMYLLGKLLFDKMTGFLSAVILATSVEYIIISRACITDMALTVFMLIGVLFFFYGYIKEKRYFYILSSAAFALAVLTKGPIAVILPAGIFLAFLFLVKDIGKLKKMPIGWCLLAFIAVAGPWYFIAYKLHGREFIDAFFGFQNVTRFMQSEHKIGSQFYYNIPVILAGFLPWSVFLPWGFWRVFKMAKPAHPLTRSPDHKPAIFILTWFFAIFVFFSISRTKLPTYVFPSFISLALMTGVLWRDILNRDIKYLRLFSGIAAALILLLIPVELFVLPQVEQYVSSKEIALKLLPMMKPADSLGGQSDYLAGLAFYADKFPVNVDRHQNMINFFNSPNKVWGVIKYKNHRDLYDANLNKDYVPPSYLIYTIGKRSIVTNRPPEDGAYLLKRGA